MGPMPSAMAQHLGDLINYLNPYTEHTQPHHPLTGEMDIYAGNPSPTIPPSGTIPQIQLEVDSKYPGEWTFKGQPEHIDRAIRLRYRFPVTDAAGNVLYWVDNHLLIGFEGTNSG